MGSISILPREFYNHSAVDVARHLLGKRLVCMENGEKVGGIIIETEAYCGEEDLACHAKAGRTARTEIMYGQPGYAYVYFNYGVHWLFNCVTASEGDPQAVLIRAIQPSDGIDIIASRRDPQPEKLWTDGPAKLTQALGIDGLHNGIDLTNLESSIYIEDQAIIAEKHVTTSPRVGLYSVPEPWQSIPWRYQANAEDLQLKLNLTTTGGTYELA